jgi:hypothetical protein
MEYCSSVVGGREVKLVVVLKRLKYSSLEVNCEVVFGRFVVLVMYNVVVVLKSIFVDAE